VADYEIDAPAIAKYDYQVLPMNETAILSVAGAWYSCDLASIQ
jgi:hypothetical protein